MSVLIMVQVQL